MAIQRLDCQKFRREVRPAVGCFHPTTGHHYSSSLIVVGVPLPVSLGAAGLARVSVGGREVLQPALGHGCRREEEKHGEKKKEEREQENDWVVWVY